MKEYSNSALLGFLLSSTLGWGDMVAAFILGIIGAAGAMIFKWCVEKWKNRNKDKSIK